MTKRRKQTSVYPLRMPTSLKTAVSLPARRIIRPTMGAGLPTPKTGGPDESSLARGTRCPSALWVQIGLTTDCRCWCGRTPRLMLTLGG